MNNRILERILRPEESCFIVPGSTPVISFGDFTEAKTLTVSINPSSLEFSTKGKLLPPKEKRLIDKESLNLGLSTPLQEEHADLIWNGCKNYFKGNPYLWFQSLETLLSSIDLSFYNGKSAHVDLVQWATFPAWNQIPIAVQRDFIANDLDFLKYQVSMPNVEQLLVNGLEVVNAINGLEGFELVAKSEIKYMSGERRGTCQLLVGTGPDNKKIIGWTSTIKSLRVSNEERARIYKEIGNWIERNS